VDGDGSTGTRLCHPEEGVNRMEGEKVSSELGVETDRRKKVKP
jgi:hypothetical protein